MARYAFSAIPATSNPFCSRTCFRSSATINSSSTIRIRPFISFSLPRYDLAHVVLFMASDGFTLFEWRVWSGIIFRFFWKAKYKDAARRWTDLHTASELSRERLNDDHPE